MGSADLRARVQARMRLVGLPTGAPDTRGIVRSILICDEANLLPRPALEQLPLLLNFDMDS